MQRQRQRLNARSRSWERRRVTFSADFKALHAEMPWGRLVKLRNFYIHTYERLDATEVWGTANRLIPRVGRLAVDLISDDKEA